MSHELFVELSQKYGPVYTIWFGMKPMVILGTHGAIMEAFRDKKNDFAGRPHFNFSEISFVSKNSVDVAFEDWGRPWEVLRRVSHSAARRLAVNPRLPSIEVGVVDEVVDLILTKEGMDKPFDLKDYIHFMVYSTIASTVAGKSVSINDKEFLELKNANDRALEMMSELMVIEFMPIMKYVFWKVYRESIKIGKVQSNWCVNVFESHSKTYKSDQIRDFCDELIHAKMEAEASDAEAAEHLNRDNLINVILDMFQAGTETTRLTLMWAFLIMASYPDVQRKLRQEITDIIGENIPTNDHRLKCVYVQCFISEVLRYAPVVPMGLPHKAIVDASACGQSVPSQTTVVPLLYAQLHDKDIWGDPEVFRPERFLDPQTGGHTTRNNSAFTPFGVGRRSCLGDKLAIISLFIQLTRILQRTQGMSIVLTNGPGSVGLDPDPNQPATYAAPEYEIMLIADK